MTGQGDTQLAKANRQSANQQPIQNSACIAYWGYHVEVAQHNHMLLQVIGAHVSLPHLGDTVTVAIACGGVLLFGPYSVFNSV
jgi:hypothetical protein